MTDKVTTRAFSESLMAELASAIGAVVGDLACVPSSSSPSGAGWRLSGTASGDLIGDLSAWIDRAGAEGVARAVMGLDETPDPASVADMLAEMWGQAAGALSLKAPFTGVTIRFGGAEEGDVPERAAACDLRFGDAVACVAVGGTAEPVAVAAPVAVPVAATPDTLDAVLDIELPLVVRFARTVMSIKALSALGPGSVIDMERSPDEPVALLVGERVIARGEVVVVGGNYGVRVTDLVSPGDRARAGEA